MKSHPLNNGLFISAPADYRQLVTVFPWLKRKGWSWWTEHFPGCNSVFDVCRPKTCLFLWNPDWAYTSPFWPLDSLSVTFGLWQWLDRPTNRGLLSMNKGWLCKRGELWAEIRSEEKVLNSSSVFQQHVQDCCHYKKWNFTQKHFLCWWFKPTPSLRKQLDFRERQATTNTETSMQLWSVLLTFLSLSFFFFPFKSARGPLGCYIYTHI